MTVTADQCNAIASVLAPAGHQCNTISDFNSRAQCFQNAPQSVGVDPNVVNACDQGHYLDTLKSQLISEEKANFPNQPDALNGPNGNGGSGAGNGHGNNGNGGSGMNNGSGNSPHPHGSGRPNGSH